MNEYRLVLFIGLFLVSSIIYGSLVKNDEKSTSSYYLDMINKYLINKNIPLGINDRPNLWIHIHNDDTIIPEYNHRHWLSFYSRGSNDFNQPYQYLTIQSILNKCDNDFNIYLINDDSFKKILPEWNINFNKMANPIKTHLRLLGISNVLKLYGGMFVPSSFICFKSLKPLYEKGIQNNKMFVGEFNNKTSSLTSNGLIASPKLIGSQINNPQMNLFIKHLEIVYSRDMTANTDFIGINNLWLQERGMNGEINLIEGSNIGVQKENGETVNIDELVGSTFIDLHDNSYGLYIPWDELINRLNCNWFVRLSPTQVLESNTMIGKYLLASHQKIS